MERLGDVREVCRRCSFHCLPNSELQINYSKLKKKFKKVEEENDKINGQIGMRLTVVSDYAIIKGKLESDIKRLELNLKSLKAECKEQEKLKCDIEREKLHLNALNAECQKQDKYVSTILQEQDKLKYDIERLELHLKSLKAECQEQEKLKSDIQKELNLNSLKAECEKQEKYAPTSLQEKCSKLEQEINNFILREKQLKESLRSKSLVIQRFLYSQIKVIKYSDSRISSKVQRAFNAMRRKVDEYALEHLGAMQSLQEAQQECQNCRSNYLQEKLWYENKIKDLENKIVNSDFVIQQQSFMITDTKHDLLTMKNECKCRKKKKVFGRTVDKLFKEGEMQLPPTPSTPGSDVAENIICLDEGDGYDSLQDNILDDCSESEPDLIEVPYIEDADTNGFDWISKDKIQQLTSINILNNDIISSKASVHKPVEDGTISLKQYTTKQSSSKKKKVNTLNSLEHSTQISPPSSATNLLNKDIVSPRASVHKPVEDGTISLKQYTKKPSSSKKSKVHTLNSLEHSTQISPPSSAINLLNKDIISSKASVHKPVEDGTISLQQYTTKPSSSKKPKGNTLNSLEHSTKISPPSSAINLLNKDIVSTKASVHKPVEDGTISLQQYTTKPSSSKKPKGNTLNSLEHSTKISPPSSAINLLNKDIVSTKASVHKPVEDGTISLQQYTTKPSSSKKPKGNTLNSLEHSTKISPPSSATNLLNKDIVSPKASVHKPAEDGTISLQQSTTKPSSSKKSKVITLNSLEHSTKISPPSSATNLLNKDIVSPIVSVHKPNEDGTISLQQSTTKPSSSKKPKGNTLNSLEHSTQICPPSSAINLLNKDIVSPKASVHKPVENGKISLQQSTTKSSSSKKPKVNTLNSLEHSTKVSPPSSATKFIAHRRIICEQEDSNNEFHSANLLPKSSNKVPVIKKEQRFVSPTTKLLMCKTDCSLESNKNKVAPVKPDEKLESLVLKTIDHKNVITPEYFSLLEETNNIEKILYQTTRIPTILSPMSPFTHSAECVKDNEDYLQQTVDGPKSKLNKRSNDFDSSSRNSKRLKSIFSPMHSNLSLSEIPVEFGKKTKDLVVNLLTNCDLEKIPDSKPQHGSDTKTSSVVTHCERRKKRRTSNGDITANISETELKVSGLVNKHVPEVELIKVVSAKCDRIMVDTASQMAFDSEIPSVSLILNTPDTTTEVSKTVDSYLSSPCTSVKSNISPKEIRDPIPQVNLYTSPQPKPSEFKSQVSLRSPTAMEHYGLRLSPKLPLNLQFSDKNSRKSCSRRIKPTEKVLKNSSIKSTKSNKSLESSCARTNISHSQDYCKVLSCSRSPESMKHYNMRPRSPLQKCKHCSSSGCVGVENLKNNPDLTKLSVLNEPHRSERSVALADITSKIRPCINDMLSEVKEERSKEDSNTLEMKLKLTPQQRLEQLKANVDLLKYIEINTDEKQTIGPSLRVPSNIRCYPPQKNRNLDSHVSKSTSINNAKSNYILANVPSHSGQSCSTSSLLKIADDLSCGSTETANTKSILSQANEIEKSSLIKYQKELCNAIDVGPDHINEVTFCEKTLLKETDMTYKCLSYCSKWNHSLQKIKCVKNRSHKEREFSNKTLTLEVLKVVNYFKRSRVTMDRIITLKQPKMKKEKHSLANLKRRFFKKYTRIVPKAKPSPGLDSRYHSNLTVKRVNGNSSVKRLGFSYPAIEDKPNHEVVNHKDCNIKGEKVHEMGDVTQVYNSHDVLPTDAYSKPEEDCLVIDIDEKSMIFSEVYIPPSATATKQATPGRKNPTSRQNDLYQGITETTIKTNFNRGSSLHNKSFTATSQCPKTPGTEIKQISEATSNVESLRSKVALPSLKSSALENKDNCSSKDVYLPNFYTEQSDVKHNEVVPQPESYSLELVDHEDEVYDSNNVNTHVFQSVTLEDLIPKGVKTEVSESVLRTVIKKHEEDLSSFIERNKTEGRVIQIKVPRGPSQKAMQIMEPIFDQDLKSIMDIVAVTEELAGFEIRVIIKAVMMKLHNLSMEASTGERNTTWMRSYSVNLPNKHSPFVHPRVQSIHLLLYLMIDKFSKGKTNDEINKFVKEELLFMELVFLNGTTEFSESPPTFWLNLGFVYTLLARHYRFLPRVRQLMYDLFYCFTKRAFTVAFAMLKVWPALLPAMPIEFYSNDPLALCIIRQLTTEVPSTGKHMYSPHMGQQLRELMAHKYRFRADTVNPDSLFDTCMQRLHQSGVYEAAVLLAKRQPMDWFVQRPLQLLTDKVKSWWKGGEECSDIEAVNAINILCSSLRPYNCVQVHLEFTKVLSLLQDILLDTSTPTWMQEVIVLNICHLARLGYIECVEAIVRWRPSEVSQEVVDRMLNNIISKRTHHWWNSPPNRSFLTR